ncbi:Keratin, type II cytoskeletal 8 [Anabarilius grahami]|uniref:Keratin, type II cytoskeletal 8 n=1 Tax=Anabarilius grahami TaxID=495550 RepID=A0A3N0XLE8_ANAGA|nr:Keratin, type II cytoskeletal 8 [Anabarilius grahami]
MSATNNDFSSRSVGSSPRAGAQIPRQGNSYFGFGNVSEAGDPIKPVSVNTSLLTPVDLQLDPDLQAVRIQEKEQIKTLNNRFATFIDKVRKLEQENKLLETKWHLLQQESKPESKLEPMLKSHISSLRAKLERVKKDKEHLDTELRNVHAQVEEQKQRYEDEINNRNKAENDFVLLKKEQHEMQADVKDTSVVVQMDNSRQLNMEKIIANVKSQYEEISACNRKEAEAWYKNKPVREVIQRGHYTPLSVSAYEHAYGRVQRGDWEAFEDVISREFPPGSVARRVVLHGGVGMGKTTVVEKVIWDWATGTRLQHYALLLRVPVLELAAFGGKAESLQSMLGRTDTQISSETLTGALQSPQSLLLVLDGLEQLQNLLCTPSSSSSLVSDVQQEASGSVLLCSLLHGSLLPGASMLITSREQVKLESLRCFEVVGFSQSQKRMFFQKFFGDVDLSERIFQQSEQALGVHEQCFRPAFCWTLCSVFKTQFESKNAPPETLTHLLSIITHTLLQKQKIHVEESREIVLGLGKLTNPVCSYTDVCSFLHRPVLSAFLCISGDVTSPDTTFSFLSPVMQEFLLATSFYLDQSVQISDERSDLYYTFLVGLSDSVQRKPIEDSVGRFDESRTSAFSQWMMGYVSTVLAGGDVPKHFGVFRLLQHARNSSLVKESVSKSQWRHVSYSEMQEADCAALSYVVSCVGEMEYMNLYRGVLTDEQAKKLKPAFRLSKSIGLCDCVLTGSCCPSLAAALQSEKCCLTELDVSVNELGQSGVMQICEALMSPNLEMLSLTDACVEELCESVAASSTLSTLILKNNQMTDSAVPQLVELMLDRPQMTELNVKYNDFSEDVFDLMETCPNIVY